MKNSRFNLCHSGWSIIVRMSDILHYCRTVRLLSMQEIPCSLGKRRLTVHIKVLEQSIHADKLGCQRFQQRKRICRRHKEKISRLLSKDLVPIKIRKQIKRHTFVWKTNSTDDKKNLNKSKCHLLQSCFSIISFYFSVPICSHAAVQNTYWISRNERQHFFSKHIS